MAVPQSLLLNPKERAAFKAFSVALLGLSRLVFVLDKIYLGNRTQSLYSEHSGVLIRTLWEILQHLGSVHTVFEAIMSHQSVLCTQSPHLTSIYGYLESLQTSFHFCCTGDDHFDSSSFKCIKSKLEYAIVCIEKEYAAGLPTLRDALDNLVLPAQSDNGLNIHSNAFQGRNEQIYFPHITHSENVAGKKVSGEGSSIPRYRGYVVNIQARQLPSRSTTMIKLPEFDTLLLSELNSPIIFPVKKWIDEAVSKRLCEASDRILSSAKNPKPFSTLFISPPLLARDISRAGILILHEELPIIAGELGRPKQLSAFLFQHRLMFLRKKAMGWVLLTTLRLIDIILVTFHEGSKGELALRVYWHRRDKPCDAEEVIDGVIILFDDLETLQLWAGFLAMPREPRKSMEEVEGSQSIEESTVKEQKLEKSRKSSEDWATQLILQADVRKQTTMTRYYEGW